MYIRTWCHRGLRASIVVPSNLMTLVIKVAHTVRPNDVCIISIDICSPSSAFQKPYSPKHKSSLKRDMRRKPTWVKNKETEPPLSTANCGLYCSVYLIKLKGKGEKKRKGLSYAFCITQRDHGTTNMFLYFYHHISFSSPSSAWKDKKLH